MARRRKAAAKGKFLKRIIKRPGAFRAKAKRAGMSTRSYANKVLKAGRKKMGRTWYQAHLFVHVLAKLPKPSHRARVRGARKAARTRRAGK
jgi:hypothetical protein